LRLVFAERFEFLAACLLPRNCVAGGSQRCLVLGDSHLVNDKGSVRYLDANVIESVSASLSLVTPYRGGPLLGSSAGRCLVGETWERMCARNVGLVAIRYG
jgi:hypothetical protein